MANKNSNVPFDQIPHIVLNHPDLNNDDIAVMRTLFKILKDKKIIIYSNEKLSIDSKISKRTLQRCLVTLENLGFIAIKGITSARRFSLGILFNTSASVAQDGKNNTYISVQKPNSSASVALVNKNNTKIPVQKPNTSAKNDISSRHGGIYTKNNTKRKKDYSLKNPLKEIIDHLKK